MTSIAIQPATGIVTVLGVQYFVPAKCSDSDVTDITTR
jgi:hypothetical protein